MNITLVGGCIAFSAGPPDKLAFAMMDEYGKRNNKTVVYASWHPNPEYRISEGGSFGRRNDEFPIGLIIVDDKGIPHPWKKSS